MQAACIHNSWYDLHNNRSAQLHVSHKADQRCKDGSRMLHAALVDDELFNAMKISDDGIARLGDDEFEREFEPLTRRDTVRR
jgi:hypothetical protein